MHSFRTTALSLVLAAGTAMPVLAQMDGNRDREGDRGRDTKQADAMRQATHEFFKSSTLIGRDVANPNGDVVGSIQDFIIDRGSGRIEHAVLKSGDFLGFGGKTIAVPYPRLGYDSAKDRFLLGMTKEQIERTISFVPDDWAELEHTTWAEQLDRWWTGRSGNGDEDDPYRDTIRDGRRGKVKGTVVSVERDRGLDGAEHVQAVVRTEDGRQSTLILGPSWYVMGQDAAPMRGDKIEAETLTVARDDSPRELVLSAKVEGEKLVLRDDRGKPRWSVAAAERPDRDPDKDRKLDRDRDMDRKVDRDRDMDRADRSVGRLMLVSDLPNAKAITHDSTAGEVQNVIIERRSGQIALIGFDPNENILGIGDEIKCVPWPLVSIRADHTVRIDASQDMLKAASKMPSDAAELNAPGHVDRAYEAFGIRPAKFSPRDTESARGAADTGWGHDGAFTRAFRDGDNVTATGEVVDVRTAALTPGSQPARIVVVKTDAGERQVVLGPEWYFERQPISLKRGDKVTVQGRRATIDGKEYVCARNLDADGRAHALWEGDKALWNGR